MDWSTGQAAATAAAVAVTSKVNGAPCRNHAPWAVSHHHCHERCRCSADPGIVCLSAIQEQHSVEPDPTRTSLGSSEPALPTRRLLTGVARCSTSYCGESPAALQCAAARGLIRPGFDRGMAVLSRVLVWLATCSLICSPPQTQRSNARVPEGPTRSGHSALRSSLALHPGDTTAADKGTLGHCSTS